MTDRRMHVEEDRWRACTDPERGCSRARCRRVAVAYLDRAVHGWKVRSHTREFAYCRDHLAEYNRAVASDGKVIWLGYEPYADTPS